MAQEAAQGIHVRACRDRQTLAVDVSSKGERYFSGGSNERHFPRGHDDDILAGHLFTSHPERKHHRPNLPSSEHPVPIFGCLISAKMSDGVFHGRSIVAVDEAWLICEAGTRRHRENVPCTMRSGYLQSLRLLEAPWPELVTERQSDPDGSASSTDEAFLIEVITCKWRRTPGEVDQAGCLRIQRVEQSSCPKRDEELG